jgi:NAD(P)-dependent dehydrogenase (short-subunit alcohol dehydrogenase family)
VNGSSEQRPRTVLITGASKGIGRACALRMHARGWRVFAGVRSGADAEDLRAGTSDLLVPVRLDVTDAGDIAGAVRIIGEHASGSLDAVVNNAGISIAAPLEFLPLDELRRQFDVNVFGAIAVTQAVMPMLRKANGRIVFISSISGRSSTPYTGAYAGSKHAIEALADALRVELMPWRMPVSLVEPGVIRTPIWETSIAHAERMLGDAPPQLDSLYGDRLAGVRRLVSQPRGLPPETVADAVEHALTARRPRSRYVVGNDARLRLLVEMLPTRIRDAIIDWKVNRL